jgi:hypothetical protein
LIRLGVAKNRGEDGRCRVDGDKLVAAADGDGGDGDLATGRRGFHARLRRGIEELIAEEGADKWSTDGEEWKRGATGGPVPADGEK